MSHRGFKSHTFRFPLAQVVPDVVVGEQETRFTNERVLNSGYEIVSKEYEAGTLDPRYWLLAQRQSIRLLTE